MLEDFVIRDIDVSEVSEVHRLIYETFHSHVSPDYSSKGVSVFLEYIEIEKIEERLSKGHDMFVAVHKSKGIIGVIEIRNYNHMSLLYVVPEYHKKGIAKKMLKKAIKVCKKMNKDLSFISANSSPYAVKIYEKLGFKKVSQEKISLGIPFTPMELNVDWN